MNERIKEIAEQASILSRQEHPELAVAVTLNDILGKTDRTVYVVDDIQTQKFAELIVQECLNKCIHVENECRENSEHKAESSATLIKLLIKEHFGVENEQ